MDDCGMILGRLPEETQDLIFSGAKAKFWRLKLGDKFYAMLRIAEEFSDEYVAFYQKFETKLKSEVGIDFATFEAVLSDIAGEEAEPWNL